jgi:hypothetical protein
VIIGGMGSVAGSLIASMAIGLQQNLTALWLGSQWSIGVAFLLAIIVLVVSPKGLMGLTPPALGGHRRPCGWPGVFLALVRSGRHYRSHRHTRVPDHAGARLSVALPHRPARSAASRPRHRATPALLSSRPNGRWICFLAAMSRRCSWRDHRRRAYAASTFLVSFGFRASYPSSCTDRVTGDAGVVVFAPLVGAGTDPDHRNPGARRRTCWRTDGVDASASWRLQQRGAARERHQRPEPGARFAIGAAFAGFAGSLFAHDAAYISPSNFGMWGTIYILVWLAIGGVSRMWGPILGAITMTLIAEFLRMSGVLQALFYAAALLIVVMAMPHGIAGLTMLARGAATRRSGKASLGPLAPRGGDA